MRKFVSPPQDLLSSYQTIFGGVVLSKEFEAPQGIARIPFFPILLRFDKLPKGGTIGVDAPFRPLRLMLSALLFDLTESIGEFAAQDAVQVLNAQS
jgi:hypothetical protein